MSSVAVQITSDMAKEFDIIIFGGTGYTGRYVIEELAISTKSTGIKWAIAGRDYEKLRKSLQMVQEYLQDINILNIPIITADVNDTESIANMCQKAKLILNCVGPYKLFGETVVSACVESKTHHVDISGELKYLETTQANYFEAARENGVYVVGACGFDSIPSDYGSTLLKKYFPGGLNSVEYYVKVEHGPLGRKTNIGTFVSTIDSVTDVISAHKYTNLLKEKLFKKKMPESRYSLPWRCPLFFSNIANGWCLRFFSATDERVIDRSHMFRNEYSDERPFEARGYMAIESFFNVFLLLISLSIGGFLSLFSCGRSILAKHPACFTFGQFTKEGPTREQVEQGKTTVIFIAKGWKNKTDEPSDQHKTAPDSTVKLTMTGPELTYSLTSKCMVHAGLVILQEQDKLPLEGGVFTPGVAFENTTLNKRLEERGVKFVFET